MLISQILRACYIWKYALSSEHLCSSSCPPPTASFSIHRCSGRCSIYVCSIFNVLFCFFLFSIYFTWPGWFLTWVNIFQCWYYVIFIYSFNFYLSGFRQVSLSMHTVLCPTVPLPISVSRVSQGNLTSVGVLSTL